MSKTALLGIIILIAAFSCTMKESSATVKKSALAGSWFSSDPSELSRQIDALMARATGKKTCKAPLVLILPHAGYQYSGNTAASGYRAIGSTGKSDIDPEHIVIIGPSHYKFFRGCAVLDADYYETPLGKLKINTDAARKLSSDSLFKTDPSAFDQEHSIEIHLPFIQRIFRGKPAGAIQILPILVGEVNDNDAGRIAAKIASAISGARPFIIISTDFTHYGPHFGYLPFKNTGPDIAAKIRELDSGAVRYIITKDLAGFSEYTERTGITMCGRNPVKIALAMQINGFKAEKIYYDTSGNITGDYTNSVSYFSILFCGVLKGAEETGKNSNSLTPEDKKYLLRAARDNITSWMAKGRGVRFVSTGVPKNCLVKRGAFVTIKNRGSLRGCIGYIAADKPLIMAVLDSSYNAAFKDPRFAPLRKEELKDTAIEISVLEEPVLVQSPKEVQVGRDGLIIARGMNRGLLLPQVATEQGWNRETFLKNACLKAGLPPDAWKDGSTKIYRFEAIVFTEGDMK
jgi:AmmeMemoRadiSam system protein B/AmmeMemoRadiSam system protein A